MRIGFTERGDAGLDLSWAQKLDSVDGAIIITKNANPKFSEALLKAHEDHPNKLVVHIGCTGLGGTWLEPNVPHPTKQLDAAASLVERGFPLDHVVIRVDPIVPAEGAITRAAKVIRGAYARKLLLPDGTGARLRISVYDEYKHVKQRLHDMGKRPFYDADRFRSTASENKQVLDMLASTSQGIPIYACAETKFVQQAKSCPEVNLIAQGCLSVQDLELMGIDPSEAPKTVNGQSRNGCLCLTCKHELLTNRKQCPHKCVYCYWR
jgi:hypothetical protein